MLLRRGGVCGRLRVSAGAGGRVSVQARRGFFLRESPWVRSVLPSRNSSILAAHSSPGCASCRGGQELGHLPLLVSPAPRQMPSGDHSAAHPALLPPQEAVDDILSALKLDPGTVVPEVRSLKPEAQALITQGLWSHCRALLSQPLDTGASLRDEDARGLLAVGEALIKIDAGQPSGHILQADVLTAMGMPGPGVGNVGVCPSPSDPSAL